MFLNYLSIFLAHIVLNTTGMTHLKNGFCFMKLAILRGKVIK